MITDAANNAFVVIQNTIAESRSLPRQTIVQRE
jgi:hypothetical protein